MPEFLTTAFAQGPTIEPLPVFVKLLIAMVLGGVVALIYKKTRSAADYTATFPGTLVLLAILIAMVTQVIGDNVARAFSLVGALSIVRFRTVVRDTQDTAFVICAVVVGMAVGASDPWVAVIGIAVVGVAAFIMRSSAASGGTNGNTEYLLHLRTGLGHDLEALAGSVLDTHLVERRILKLSTAKQGIAIDASYAVRFRQPGGSESLVKALNRLEGIQSVEIVRRGEPEADAF